MKHKIYSIYDSKAETFSHPSFYPTKGVALRVWTQTLEKGDTQLSKSPGDFTLFELGEFNDQSAEITMLQAPVRVGTALEFLNQSEGGNR